MLNYRKKLFEPFTFFTLKKYFKPKVFLHQAFYFFTSRILLFFTRIFVTPNLQNNFVEKKWCKKSV